MMRYAYLSAFVVSAVFSASSVLAQPQIIGRWEGINQADKLPMSFLFGANNQGVMVFPDNPTLLVGFAFAYSIDPKPKPMHFDFQVPFLGQAIPTILELTNAQSLRLQMQGTNPGAARPTAFKNELKLQKVSDTAIANLSAQLAQAEQSKEGEGQSVITALVRSTMIYELETNQFPTTLEQLGLRNSATQNYRFELSSDRDQLRVIARPNKAGLRSYVGLVFAQTMTHQGKQQDIAIARICQSVRPSQNAPALPKVLLQSEFNPLSIECSSDSEPAKF